MANNSPIPTAVTDDDELSMGTLVRRLSISLVLLLIVIGVLGLTVREPLEAMGKWFVENGGLSAVFFSCFLLDSMPFATHEPILFFGYSGGLGFWPVFFFAAAGSVCSGTLGWALGGLAGRFEWVRSKLDRYKVTGFLNRYGVWAIAVAAITPFPFAISTWGAGAAGVPWAVVFRGSLFRIPKVLFYLSLIAAGWNVGA